MSCRQSKKQIRSYVPEYAFAPATSNVGPVRDSRVGRPLASGLDRRLVVVEPAEPRVRIRVGHHDHRRAMTATDIGHARARLELLLNPVERRDPRAGKIRAIAGAEEPLGPLEQARVVVAPSKSAVAPERALDLLYVSEHRPRTHSSRAP